MLNNVNPLMAVLNKKKIYLYQNTKLKYGGRKAVRSTEKNFDTILSNLKNKAIERGYEVDSYGKYDWLLDEAREMFTKLNEDLLKINFDWENHGVEPHIFITSNGVPYLRCFAGGDWENPVRFFIYWDGKNLRGYIPKKGNVFNAITKEAFGNNYGDKAAKENDYYCIVKDICPELTKKYAPSEIVKMMKDGGFDTVVLEFQDDWCLEDFENRLEVCYAIEDIEEKSDALFEKLANLLKKKGLVFEETDDVCEDYDREFVFVCSDNPDLNETFDMDRHALLYSYGSDEDECPCYITIDPQGDAIELFESGDQLAVLDWMENHMEELVNKLCEFYNSVAQEHEAKEVN